MMAEIQLTNLQLKNQLTARKLSQTVGGDMDSVDKAIQDWQVFTDPYTPRGVVVNSVMNSSLPPEQIMDIIDFLWWNPGANIQIVAPL